MALNFAIRNSKVVSSSPTFSGANPHEVPIGEHKGMRVLDRQEDLARALVKSLNPAQRKEAIFDQVAPEDIVTMPTLRAKIEGSPKGIASSHLTVKQREMLTELISEYANNLAPALADKRLKQARQTPADDLFFGWAGRTERPVLRPIVIGKPTVGNRDEQGLYYRVQSPEFLIEYDNTQAHARLSGSVRPSPDAGKAVMRRRGFLQGAAGSALAQGTAAPPIRAALMIEPAKDHLGYYYRTGLCAGVGEFAVADETGETFGAARKALGDRTIRTYQDPVRMMAEFRPHVDGANAHAGGH